MKKKQLSTHLKTKVPDDDASSTTIKGKTWGPSSMTSQRERGFLPALRSVDQQSSLVKSAPNLDHAKSRSVTSKSADNILGNSVEHSERLSPLAQPSPTNHHYVNISSSSHTIYFERELHNRINENAKNDCNDNNSSRKMSSNSINSRERSIESFECYDSDQSDHATTVGCFSFVGGNSSERKKKYKKLQKSSPPATIESPSERSISFVPGTSDKKSSGSRKNSAIDGRKALNYLTQKINTDLSFYHRMQQGIDAVGSQDALDEDDECIYIRSKRSKNKNKLSMRLQQSLEAIDAYDPEDFGPGGGNRHVKVYSKSIDNISMAGDYQFERNGSQFTRECFLKNGSRTANGNNVDNRDSGSSGDDSAVWSQNHRQY